MLRKVPSYLQCRKLSVAAKQKWDILCGVSLERYPVITKDLNEIEKKMDRLLKEVELENSYKSDFERRMEEDEKRQALLKSGKLDDESLDAVGQQTAHDYMDSCVAEAKAFALAPRKDPKADKDVKSTFRCLDRPLLLLVKERLGEGSLWVLPQGPRADGETLRQTANRILSEKIPGVKARLYGNAPNGFYKYRYPKTVGKDSVGAKIFFYKAQYLSGSLAPRNDWQDYQWATRPELALLPPAYRKSVNMFLIDEH